MSTTAQSTHESVEAMTPGEFRATIDYLGLTQDEAATFPGIDVGARTVRHWVAGKYAIPGGVRDVLDDALDATDDAVAQLTADLSESGDRVVVVWRRDEDMWAARPEFAAWPARWWRHVVMRAAAEVGGVRIEFADDDQA